MPEQPPAHLTPEPDYPETIFECRTCSACVRGWANGTLIDAIEEEFGSPNDCQDCPEECPGSGGLHVQRGWPALDLDAGWRSFVTSKRAKVAGG